MKGLWNKDLCKILIYRTFTVERDSVAFNMRNLLLLLFPLFFACKKQDDLPQPEILRDLAYGTQAKQKLDLYLPTYRSSDTTKLLIFIHGGGWTEGDKADFNASISEMQKRIPQLAIANINYRLAANGQNLFPAQEEDVKEAIRFLLERSATYRISKTHAILGASAGAHLSLLQSYKYPDANNKAVISLFAPTELTSMYNNPINPLIPALLLSVTGTTPQNNSALYKNSSPVTFITPTSTPTLIFQGGADIVVDPAQALLLKDALISKNVPYQYVFYPGEGHGWVGLNLIDTFEKVEQFLRSRLL